MTPGNTTPNRVAANLRLLIALWMAAGIFRILSSLAPPWLLISLFPGLPMSSVRPFDFAIPLKPIAWLYLLLATAAILACIATAWSLMERAPWARRLAIVVAVFALGSYPVGTSLRRLHPLGSPPRKLRGRVPPPVHAIIESDAATLAGYGTARAP